MDLAVFFRVKLQFEMQILRYVVCSGVIPDFYISMEEFSKELGREFGYCTFVCWGCGSVSVWLFGLRKPR